MAATGSAVVAEAFTLALVTVWLVAVYAKLRDRPSFQRALSELLAPVPRCFLRVLATAVPAAELLLAVLTAAPPTRLIGLALSAATLGTFTGALARAHRRGVRVGCACFGQRSGEPLDGAAVTRTALLTAFALAGTSLMATSTSRAFEDRWSTTLVAAGLGGAALLAGALVVEAVRLTTTIETQMTTRKARR